jgi:hypothetical protein
MRFNPVVVTTCGESHKENQQEKSYGTAIWFGNVEHIAICALLL